MSTIYAVLYKGPISDYDPSIVSIHKTKELAEQAKATYINNCKENNIVGNDNVYRIIGMNTEREPIYDFKWYLDEEQL